MATTKQKLRDEVEMQKDDPQELICYYQSAKGIVRCPFDDLPELGSEDDDALRGDPCIAFSARYVYVKSQYDGEEWFEAIPRHPAFVENSLPFPGG